jgi:hypothetical protein
MQEKSMAAEMNMVRCIIARGGTSKGIYVLENELPRDQRQRDSVILSLYGSPDVRQIDGLGGADPLTSKLAILGPPTRPDADVDYTFGQVSFDQPFVDYKGNCGNISAGVGPVAIAMGLVRAVEPVTTVRIHMTNSDRMLIAEVPVLDGRAAVEGDLVIDGCPGSGARITLDWSDSQGAFTGKLLPTGNAKDEFVVDGRTYPVSLVDAGNPLIFVSAASLGMEGIETPAQIEANLPLMALIETLRGQAAKIFGLVDKAEDATRKSPYNPFFCIVSPPRDYHTFNDIDVKAGDIDIVSRLLFMLRMHKTHPGTGTVCLGAAARIPGSIVYEALRPAARDRLSIKIGHPAGIIPVESEVSLENGVIQLKRAAIYRTARLLMEGYAYVRKGAYK